MEFCQHGIPSTRNSVDMEFRQHEFCRHEIPSTRNSAYVFFTSVYSVCFAMLFIFIPTLIEFHTRKYKEFCGISRILRVRLYNMYEFEYFNCKVVRIKSKLSGLSEVESANFFLSLLITNPLISPTESVR
jgi:hypothetical protein